MANYAYVRKKTLWDFEQLKKDLQEVNDTKLFGMFRFEFYREKDYSLFNIYLIHNRDDCYPMQWQGWVDDDTPKELIFQHRYGSAFGWFVEKIFRETIGAKYQCVQADDGYEEVEPSNPNVGTFKDYVYNTVITKKFFKHQWKIAQEGLPKEILKLIKKGKL